ncbi:protein of unknown function [Maridesulfovibrio hydrothermalis AM13 = DSM 14728]|uniref:Uncharacterized protein n=1 Tax=Maridesulfovibrio hydrothermalis AM13 = DSM 14728 TaxID=1121451 RepID=L0RCK4_9BACT|nr:protein of unknown function [Maridesulfovibrio hydrothermalis AM13 = DSM 14728]
MKKCVMAILYENHFAAINLILVFTVQGYLSQVNQYGLISSKKY